MSWQFIAFHDKSLSRKFRATAKDKIFCSNNAPYLCDPVRRGTMRRSEQFGCWHVLIKYDHDKVKVSEAASIAGQPGSQRYQSREGSVVSDTILRKESTKHGYVLQHIETWQGLLRWVERSRINRNQSAQLRTSSTLISLVDFELCCSDSSLLSAITIEHCFQTNPNSLKTTYHAIYCYIIAISPPTIVDSHNKRLSQPQTDRRSIATQRSTIADFEIRMSFLNS